MQVSVDQLPAEPLCSKEISATDPYFKQLSPGDSVSWSIDLPPVYFNARVDYETYEIFWRGGKIRLWDWGTLPEYIALHHQLIPKSPGIVLPSGPHHSFRVDDESDLKDDVGVWPCSPAPMSPSARMDDAPIFSVNIAGPPTLSVKDRSD